VARSDSETSQTSLSVQISALCLSRPAAVRGGLETVVAAGTVLKSLAVMLMASAVSAADLTAVHVTAAAEFLSVSVGSAAR
jgi:hypothetical protein